MVACDDAGHNSGGGSGAQTCCSTMDDAGGSTCVCQPEGMVSAMGISSTLTVNGSSCTVSTTYNGMTQTGSGSVVSACH